MIAQTTIVRLHQLGFTAHDVQTLDDAVTRSGILPRHLTADRAREILRYCALGGDSLALKLATLPPITGEVSDLATAYGDVQANRIC